MIIKGAIFDVDGTILDSMHIWYEIGQRYLEKLGIEAETGLGEKLYPMSIEEGSLYLKDNYGLSDSREKITSDIWDLLKTFYFEEVELKPGVYEYLSQLKNKGIPMAIATLNDRDILNRCFSRLGIADFFSEIVTCSELGVTKREPTIYLATAEKMGCRPENTIVFEDVLHCLEAAKSVGFVIAAVEDPSSIKDREEIKRIADIYITSFSEELEDLNNKIALENTNQQV